MAFSLRRLSRFSAAVGSMVLPVAFADSNKKASREHLAIYLTPESQIALRNHTAKVGLPGYQGTCVVIKSDLSETDSYIYQPLYGEKAVFRFKGVIEAENAGVAGIGRASTFAGELLDDDFYPSLPLFKQESKKNTKGSSLSGEGVGVGVDEVRPVDRKEKDRMVDRATMDLPSRLYRANKVVITDMPLWKGRLIAGTVLG